MGQHNRPGHYDDYSSRRDDFKKKMLDGDYKTVKDSGWCSVGNPPLGIKELFLFIRDGLLRRKDISRKDVSRKTSGVNQNWKQILGV